MVREILFSPLTKLIGDENTPSFSVVVMMSSSSVMMITFELGCDFPVILRGVSKTTSRS